MSDMKYQWSIFPDGNRNEQYVVREDDWETFTEGIKKVQGRLGQQPVEPEQQTNETTKQAEEGGELTQCPAHPDEKVFWKEGKFGRFYSHGYKMQDGSWVNCTKGAGYKQ